MFSLDPGSCLPDRALALYSGIGKETAAALLRRKAHGMLYCSVLRVLHAPCLMCIYMLCSKRLSCSPVILACRNMSRGESIKLALEADAKQHGNMSPCAEVMLLDIASLQSIRDFAQQWTRRQKPLHCLINNAGVFFILGRPVTCHPFWNTSNHCPKVM